MQNSAQSEMDDMAELRRRLEELSKRYNQGGPMLMTQEEKDEYAILKELFRNSRN